MEMQDVENAVDQIARPQVGGVDTGVATIVSMCQYPRFQEVVFSLVYTETETGAFQKCSTQKSVFKKYSFHTVLV